MDKRFHSQENKPLTSLQKKRAEREAMKEA
jgi:hypothetical protein